MSDYVFHGGMIRIIATIFCALLAMPAFADKVRVNLGFWPGELQPEQENRLLKDDLIAGASVGRLDLEWTNKETYTIYPLGVQYMMDGIGPGTLIIGGNYIRYSPAYKFNALTLGPSIGIINLQNFKNSDWEAEAGYQLALLDKKLLVTPKFGARWHFQEYDYDELTIGVGSYAKSFDSPFRANAKGTYVGSGVQYYVTPELSILGEYIMSTPFFGNVSGAMTDKRNTVGVVASVPYIQIERANAGYEVEIKRWMLGVQYDVMPQLHIQAGLRQEIQTAKYTGYFNLPILITGTSVATISPTLSTVGEIITDKLFWEAAETQKKGFVFIGASYDVNL